MRAVSSAGRALHSHCRGHLFESDTAHHFIMRELLKALGSFLLDTIEIITTAFALFVVIFLFIAQLHEVQGNSMLPNLKDQQYVLTDKISYHFKGPQRGEIVVFKAPPNPRKEYIKRVIALPGEQLKIDKNKIIIFDDEHPEGFVLNEPYLANGTKIQGNIAIPANQKITVPEDSYFVLGDNREASSDSRQWGGVKKEMIVGRAIFVIWPPNSLGRIPKINY